MLKLSDWNSMYVRMFDWALSRMTSRCLKFYGDTSDGWKSALLAFYRFQNDLFARYAVTYKSGENAGCVKGLEFSADELSELIHMYMSSCDCYTARRFLFNWWSDLRYCTPGALPTLGCADDYLKPATKEEIERARADFGHIEEAVENGEPYTHDHTFSDDAKVLEYRGRRFIVDEEWGDAWTKDASGRPISFQLRYDWWYPIDEYLDL